MNISRAALARGAARAQAMQNRLSNLKKKGEKVATTVVHTVEVGSSAFMFGMLQGKTGGIELVGIPLELMSAIALHGAAFMGLGGKMSSHLHGFGDGALAAYATTMGRGIGLNWKSKEGGGSGLLETPASTRGIGQGTAVLSDMEVAAAVKEAVTVGG
jgi:hypothetical protein